MDNTKLESIFKAVCLTALIITIPFIAILLFASLLYFIIPGANFIYCVIGTVITDAILLFILFKKINTEVEDFKINIDLDEDEF
jgi:hypothetical protein